MIVKFWDKETMPCLVNPLNAKPQTATMFLGGFAEIKKAVWQVEFQAIGHEEQEAFDEFYEDIKYGVDPFLMMLTVNGQEDSYLCKMSGVEIKRDYPTISNITASIKIIPAVYSINEEGEFVVDDAYNAPQIINLQE